MNRLVRLWIRFRWVAQDRGRALTAPPESIATWSVVRNVDCDSSGFHARLRDWQSVRAIAMPNDVELKRIEFADIVAVENLGDLLEPNGWPGVKANENVAGVNAVL